MRVSLLVRRKSTMRNRQGRFSSAALIAFITAPGLAGAPGPGAAPAPTFSRDVATLLFRHCTMCHHAGGAAPFPLLSYDEAASRAKQIVLAIQSRRMPPWQPEPGYGEFLNDRRLSEAEITTIATWANQGSPEGPPRDLPPRPQYPDGWQLGKPDLTLTMTEPFEVRANSAEAYRCFVLPAALPADRYLRAVELRPGRSGVVHHAIVVEDPRRAGRNLEKEPGKGYPCDGGFGFAMPGMLTMWTAGTVAHADPEGIAATLRRNSDLVIQLHLRPHNKDATVRASIGLYFAEKRPKRTPFDLSITSYDVDIPPGKADYKVASFSYVPMDVDAFSIYAHAHFLATGFKVTATLPEGEVKPLLLIRHWNFDWQENYWFTAPLRLPAGTRLDMEVTYDNSAGNPRNPNSPPKRVTWGFRGTDEMCEVHVRAAAVDSDIVPPSEHVH
jgi:mono/diheme cytochrome c family protein